MTEPNKELPKEVLFDLGAFGQRGAAKAWKYAQTHYAPIIEAKDKEIAEANRELAKTMGHLQISLKSCERREQTIAEKDKRIAELEAEVKKVAFHKNTEQLTPIEMLKEYIAKSKVNDVNDSQYWRGYNLALTTIYNKAHSLIPDETGYYMELLKGKQEKIMNLLKESRFDLYNAQGIVPSKYSKLYVKYCKENGIDLGGE